jgi:hypothetical protein
MGQFFGKARMYINCSKHLCIDIDAVLNWLVLLHCETILQGSVYAPSFDHGVGDPVEDDIFVNLQWVS